MKKNIKVGSRQSQLAMWQTEYVVKELKNYFPEYNFEIIPIKTKGDIILDVALAKIGDKGLFTKELEIAMLNKEIDFAVHSMKDLPTEVPEGLEIAAVTKRHDPRDVLVSNNKDITFLELSLGARIGTSSLRRKAQLLHHRPDLKIIDVRGNLNTRFIKMKEENMDGMILAAAGVERLGLQEKIAQKLDYSLCLPAVGQGALGIEMRQGDEDILNIINKINDNNTFYCVSAERALLKKLEGGCQIPIGAIANISENTIKLEAMVASTDGKRLIREKIAGEIHNAENIGNLLAEKLIQLGADEILKEIRQEIEA